MAGRCPLRTPKALGWEHRKQGAGCDCPPNPGPRGAPHPRQSWPVPSLGLGQMYKCFFNSLWVLKKASCVCVCVCVSVCVFGGVFVFMYVSVCVCVCLYVCVYSFHSHPQGSMSWL